MMPANPIDIDLNCDMGESYGRWTLGADAEIMPFITSASVACGFHGGDPHVMRKTVSLALAHGVAIGAHPSLPDLMGFGRRAMAVTAQELKDYFCYQTGALREFLRASGASLQHVKAHGILYDMMEKDEALARAAGEAVLESGGKDLIMVALACGSCDRASRARGVRVASEGFADRAYNADATLVSRRLAGSLIDDPKRAAAQAVRMATEGKVRTLDGRDIAISVQTICCHGDTPGAPEIVQAVREALEQAGCRVRPMREVVSPPA
ncbi:MAG: LamB/YcsF family protein [Burkholderiales bacterium]|nr:LamB/YcsF family protein [Burkholderiales bacterium]